MVECRGYEAASKDSFKAKNDRGFGRSATKIYIQSFFIDEQKTVHELSYME